MDVLYQDKLKAKDFFSEVQKSADFWRGGQNIQLKPTFILLHVR